MTPEQWNTVKAVLAEALELPRDGRGAFLEQRCAGDDALRRQVELLLEREEQANSHFLDRESLANAAAAILPEKDNPWVGRRIGAYQIVEQIGAGGMGEVYRAVRADDQYSKEVALKVIRAGQDSGAVITRFRNERQILATLDHPNIARLLDGGTTEGKLPYLVMELIEGEPLEEYCDAKKLSIPDRLRIFLQLCGAVQYAHQRLIIHRDIKPGNILVTADGTPKLLDFGIAKVLGSDLPLQRNDTVTEFRALTPEYASPEQIEGEPVTTASDVYSLGVVLYGLLTGQSPFSCSGRTPQEFALAIRRDEPERPSSIVSRTTTTGDRAAAMTSEQIAAARGSSPQKLRKQLSGDLDNIILMALRKEPSRRYGSAEQFAADIRRHLESIPVLARKDTTGYRVAKFVGRHKIGVAASCVVLLMIVASMGMIVRSERKARAEQARAQQRFNDVRKLAHSLMFEIHDSIRTLPGATAARQLIIQRAQEYLDSLAAESKSDPALMRELAAAYERLASVQGEITNANLGDSGAALRNYRRAVELRQAVVAASPGDNDSQRELAESYLDLWKMEESAPGSKQFLEKAIALLQPLAASFPAGLKIQSALARTFEAWGAEYAQTNQWKESQASYEKGLRIYQRLVSMEPANQQYQSDLSFAHKRLGSVLIMQKQLPSALEHYRAALSIDEARLNADPQNAARRYNITFAYSDTGYILGQQGEIEGALDYYRKALAIRKALAEADPNDVRARDGMAITYSHIGDLLLDKKQFAESLTAYKEALGIREALARRDSENEGKHLAVAKSEADIAGAYVQMAFQPAASSAQTLDSCRRTESLLQRAIPVLRKQKSKLFGNEVQYLTDAEKDAGRCTREISRLASTHQEAVKAPTR